MELGTDALRSWTLCLLALIGHFALCIAAMNRLRSFGLRRQWSDVIERGLLAILLGILVLGVLALTAAPESLYDPWATWTAGPIATAYLSICCVYAMTVTWLWTLRKWRGPTRRLLSNDSRTIRVDRVLATSPVGDWRTRAWASLPGNQILQLEVNEKVLRMPQLPASLDAMRIAHLSDLHFTGQLTRDYFDLIVDQTNAMHPDLIAITGDIIDKAECLGWFPDVLGRLTSRLGVYCVLGNHERRLPDKDRIVDAIRSAGMHYLGGRSTTVAFDGQTILLAGNELPWWGPAPDVPLCPTPDASTPALRILLAHTPDRIFWAVRYRFDLMMAGHTHGGQIRFPVIGPVLTQSRYGVRFAGGTYFQAPTMLHVSRGLSGCQPLRILCRPELALLVLRSEASIPGTRPPIVSDVPYQVSSGGGGTGGSRSLGSA